MIEIIVGLVAMVVLISGLIQIVSFTRAQTDVIIEAREMAGEMAFQDMPISAFAGYIQDIEVGPDGRTYSSDDTTTDADASLFEAEIVGQLVSQSEEWDTLDNLPTSPFSSLHESDVPFTEFGLLRGSASASVPTDPAVRHLLYDAAEIEIACEVWTTWTRGIY